MLFQIYNILQYVPTPDWAVYFAFRKLLYDVIE